jgi:hypothetical protein
MSVPSRDDLPSEDCTWEYNENYVDPREDELDENDQAQEPKSKKRKLDLSTSSSYKQIAACKPLERPNGQPATWEDLVKARVSAKENGTGGTAKSFLSEIGLSIKPRVLNQNVQKYRKNNNEWVS